MAEKLRAAPAPAPDLWPYWPVASVFSLCWLVLGWPWLSGQVTIPWDAKAHFLPQIQFLANSLARGESPFWTPFVFSGHPQIADPQSLIFSPPFLALALFDSTPGSRELDTTVLGIVLGGGLALILWFRDRGWHWAGAIIAALAFCFGASMAWRIQHTGQVLSLATLAVVLLLLSRALERRSWAYGLAAGITAGLMVLGRDQVALLGVYFLVANVLWHWVNTGDAGAEMRSTSLALAAGAIGGLLIIAIPVLTTAEIAQMSNRPQFGVVEAGHGSLHPALIVSLFTPDVFGASGHMADYWGPPSYTWENTGLYIAQNMGQLYIGAIPLLLLIACLAGGGLWNREIRFFLAASVAMFLYALGWYTPVFALAHTLLPGVDLFRRPADATFLIGFLLAILAGYSTHRFFMDPRTFCKSLAAAAGITIIAFVFAIAVALYFGRAPQAAVPLFVSGVTMAGAAVSIWAASRLAAAKGIAAAAVLTAFTVTDLAWNNGPGSSTALPPKNYDVLEPDTKNETIAFLKRKVAETANSTRRDRVELAGLGFHWPNASLTHSLENTLGYNPVRLQLYSRATGAEDHVGLPDQRKFSPLFPSYRSKLADQLGLRFVATGVPITSIDHTLTPNDFKLIARTGDAFIYENPRALPRVQFAHQARTADFGRMLDDGQWPDADLTDTVLLEDVPSATASRQSGSAHILDYQNTEILVEANSPDGGWVILNDVWHPWWTAEIDGQAVKLERANVIFRAVEVPPGKHKIRFVFRPVSGALRMLVRPPT